MPIVDPAVCGHRLYMWLKSSATCELKVEVSALVS